MFSKTTLFVTAFMAVIVSASPVPDNYGSCNTGTIQCCQQVHDAQSASAAALLGLIGIPANGLTGQIGTTCTPITGIGLGSGSTCRQAPMCCSDNKYNGLVVLGCNPINAGL